MTPTSIIIDPARPVMRAPARSELSPRFSKNVSTGALTSQAKKPRAYPTSQNPNSTSFLPMLYRWSISPSKSVNGRKIGFLYCSVNLGGLACGRLSKDCTFGDPSPTILDSLSAALSDEISNPDNQMSRKGSPNNRLVCMKSIKFQYPPTPQVTALFRTFRQMCNDAIRIAIATNSKSKFDLISDSYQYLKGYGLHTHYILNACEVAFSVFQRWRSDAPREVIEIMTLPYFQKEGVLWHLARLRIKLPLVKRPFLKLDNQTYKLDYLLLRIPVKPRLFEFIVLEGSIYHRTFLADLRLKRGSLTISESSVIVTFTRTTNAIETLGKLGIDVNERNVTWSDSSGKTVKEDLTQVVEIRERYKAIRATIAQRTNRDRRTMRKQLAKYGKRERDRATQLVHRISKSIVENARQNRFEIKMEELKGVRKLYRRGNGRGNSFRGRMNTWMFREIQRQVEYKATWDGIPVAFVNPRGTSRICLCGSRVTNLGNRRLRCFVCGKTWDRDELASKNIMAAPSARAARPSRGSNDGGTRR